ncbi:hypothetical protein BV898_14154 [Hypsibius exemplaris]|uniref:Uncharacterized protein n=1 Tax=Hypsibius exemplaris TaxID=2072580 RepID=A0A1W0W8T7_HYPEX|nr:hypothetical protein BV898_14154 [Hypsibius exemplaris]
MIKDADVNDLEGTRAKFRLMVSTVRIILQQRERMKMKEDEDDDVEEDEEDDLEDDEDDELDVFDSDDEEMKEDFRRRS